MNNTQKEQKEQNYDYLYISDPEDDDPNVVDYTGRIRSRKKKISVATYNIYTTEVTYDLEAKCLRANIKNSDPITLNFLTRFKNFKVVKEWLYNKDLICTDEKEIEEYLSIKNLDDW